MPKYLCIRRSEKSGAPSGNKPSPAQMEQMYARFNAWKEQFADNIVDMGGKLADGGKILTPDSTTDGPFVEAKEVVGGFMILAADNIEHAEEIARGCPGAVSPGGTLELREISTP